MDFVDPLVGHQIFLTYGRIIHLVMANPDGEIGTEFTGKRMQYIMKIWIQVSCFYTKNNLKR